MLSTEYLRQGIDCQSIDNSITDDVLEKINQQVCKVVLNLLFIDSIILFKVLYIYVMHIHWLTSNSGDKMLNMLPNALENCNSCFIFLKENNKKG